MALPNPDMDFTPFDTLPASTLDDIIENVESLADGTGFTAGAIPSTALADNSVTPAKLNTNGTTVGTSGSITPPADVTSYAVTALGANATINAPLGTPDDMQSLTLRIVDDGTSRTLSFNTIYQAVGVTLPTATVVGKLLYISMRYNAPAGKWDILSVGRQA